MMKCEKILFISLGCDKNRVDSEMMMGLLLERGYRLTNSESDADIVVINTCCFINDAKQESIDTILEIAELKKKGSVKTLVVAGCLAQRYKKEIQKEIPEVDIIIGTAAIDEIADALDEFRSRYKPLDTPPLTGVERRITTRFYSYLKIAEGCNKRCTYCIIPQIRGSYRSVPMESLVKEAEFLADKGARELILVAQETTIYGTDLYGKKMLPELLRRICAVKGILWVRILYCYPEEIDDELIQTIKTEPKLCHYLDLPIQHACDGILKRMGRKTDKRKLVEIIEKLRAEIPDICIRTTLITGFPGETDTDHQELMDFVEQMKFDRLGVFTYSQEEGTPAAEMPDQIPDDIKEERRSQLMELQQKIAFDRALSMKGRLLDVIVEGKILYEDTYVSRSYMDVPDVDGYLFINTKNRFPAGSFLTVRVTGADGYDLIGELEDEFA